MVYLRPAVLGFGLSAFDSLCVLDMWNYVRYCRHTVNAVPDLYTEGHG